MREDMKISVRITRVKGSTGEETLMATVPLNLLFEKGFDANWFEKELKRFERRYFYLVTCLKSILTTLHSKLEKDRRVLLYWELGNKIVEFENYYNDSPLFLESITKSLSRDVGIYDKTITRCKRFRVLFPDITEVDSNRSFNSYVASFERGYVSEKKRSKKKKQG